MSRRLSFALLLTALALTALAVVGGREWLKALAQGCEGTVVVADDCFPTADPGTGELSPVPVRNGDINVDGKIDLTDAVFLLNHLFLGGPEPAEIVCGRCDDSPKVCFRFYNDLTCGTDPFTATLSVCGQETLTTVTGEWSDCVCLDPGEADPPPHRPRHAASSSSAPGTRHGSLQRACRVGRRAPAAPVLVC